MEKDNKKNFMQKISKGKKMGKDQFVICILAGILLIVIAMPTSKNPVKQNSESVLLDSEADIIEVKEQKEYNSIYTGEEITSVEEYERYVENKLEHAISVMEGAGKVKVMVTVNSSKELVVEKDIPMTRNNTVENDAEGGNRTINELEDMEETVYSKESDGSSHPYVIKTLQPVVEGVVVVAQGGGSQTVSKNIVEVIVALFDIEPHKIKVVKMKSE